MAVRAIPVDRHSYQATSSGRHGLDAIEFEPELGHDRFQQAGEPLCIHLCLILLSLQIVRTESSRSVLSPGHHRLPAWVIPGVRSEVQLQYR